MPQRGCSMPGRGDVRDGEHKEADKVKKPRRRCLLGPHSAAKLIAGLSDPLSLRLVDWV